MKRLRLLIAALGLAVAAGRLAAENGLGLQGYGRAKVGALVKDASYFIAETTFDLRLSYGSGSASLYGNPVLYEREGSTLAPELRELFIDLRGDRLDLRLGKQQIIWGRAEGVFITDIVSPKDLSEFVVPEFEELRRAVTGARLDFYAGPHAIELVWLPWFTPTIPPGADSLWAPALPYAVSPILLSGELPALTVENGEYFARYSYAGEAIDLSLMGGYSWNDSPAYTLLSAMPLTLQPEYYRVLTLGYTFSSSLGPFIVRAEGAGNFGKRIPGNPAAYPAGYAEKNSLQYLLGADFSLAGGSIGLQFIQEIVLDHEEGLMDEAVKNTATLVAAKSFFRERAVVELFAYLGLDTLDAMIKPKITWDAADGLELFAGAYLFFGEEGDFGQYDENDGIYLGAKMSF